MNELTPNKDLANRIARLEQEKSIRLKALQVQLHHAGRSLKPSSLLKGAIMEISESTQVKSLLWKAALGLAVGFVVKKMVSGQTPKKGRSSLGNMLQFGMDILKSQQYKILQVAGVFVAKQIWTALQNRRIEKQKMAEQQQVGAFSES
jgi:hypothetical protein